MKRTTIAGLVVIAALSCGKKEPSATRDPRADAGASTHAHAAVQVDPALVTSGRIVVAPVARRAMRGDLRVPAEVVPSETGAAEVGALIAGRVGSIEVREGDAVKRGQVLAYLDSPEAARLAADMIRARSRIGLAARKLERQQGLAEDRATSAAAVDEARMELAIAEADVAAARTLLTSLGMSEPPASTKETLAARVPIRSPIDGVVVERMLALGAPVTLEKTLFRVLARDRVVVDARWTDPSTPPPAKDTAVQLLARGAEKLPPCSGKVVSTLGVVDDRTRARRVRIIPDAACPMLVPGAFVDAAFTSASLGTEAARVLAVPKEAIVDVRGAPTAFVALSKPGSFASRVVRVGPATSEDVTVEDGLVEGDSVVVVGAVLLKGELLRSELE